MDKSVLVVGGAGYLAGLLTDQLLAEGHRVTVYDNLTYEARFLKDVDFVKGCVTETDKLLDLSRKYDVVIWMAAIVGDQACEVDVQKSELVNYESVRLFCKDKPHTCHMIFMSTCSVYGVGEGVLDEGSPTNPLSTYARTKLAAEEAVGKANGTIIRLGTMYRLDDTYSRLRFDLVVNVMTIKAMQGSSISVFGGEQWRPIISVKDVAWYLCRATEKPMPGIYVLSYKNTTMADLAEEVASALGGGIKVTYTDMPFEDLRNYRVCSDKAVRTWGQPEFSTVAEEVQKLAKIVAEGRIMDIYDPVYHNGNYLGNIIANQSV